MGKEAIKEYASQHWKPHLLSVSKLSSSSGESGQGLPLVDDETLLYSFDAMSAERYPADLRPTSVDAFYFTRCGFGFVEFKTGFVPKITKKKFDPSKAKCRHSGDVCEDFWKIFWEKQKHEKKILIDSLRLKAIESYITFEKMLFPQSTLSSIQNVHKKLTIVIDVEPVENMCDDLTELSGAKSCTSCKQSICAALNRLQCHGNGCHFFYDEICVISAVEFKTILMTAQSSNPDIAELFY